jgi:hypothetical protein
MGIVEILPNHHALCSAWLICFCTCCFHQIDCVWMPQYLNLDVQSTPSCYLGLCVEFYVLHVGKKVTGKSRAIFLPCVGLVSCFRVVGCCSVCHGWVINNRYTLGWSIISGLINGALVVWWLWSWAQIQRWMRLWQWWWHILNYNACQRRLQWLREVIKILSCEGDHSGWSGSSCCLWSRVGWRCILVRA